MSPPRDHYRRIPLSAKKWQELRRHADDYKLTRTRLCAQIILDWMANPRPLSVVLDERRPHSQRGVKRGGLETEIVCGIAFPKGTPGTIEEWEKMRAAEKVWQKLVDGKLT